MAKKPIVQGGVENYLGKQPQVVAPRKWQSSPDAPATELAYITKAEKDLTENTEFRIKWPRGQLGSLPADSEQFMMIEDLYKTVDKLNIHIESMALNKVNIEFLRKQMDKVLEDIEELKDKARDMHYKNGNTH